MESILNSSIIFIAGLLVIVVSLTLFYSYFNGTWHLAIANLKDSAKPLLMSIYIILPLALVAILLYYKVLSPVSDEEKLSFEKFIETLDNAKSVRVELEKKNCFSNENLKCDSLEVRKTAMAILASSEYLNELSTIHKEHESLYSNEHNIELKKRLAVEMLATGNLLISYRPFFVSLNK